MYERNKTDCRAERARCTGKSRPCSPNTTHLPLMISVRFCSVTELNTSSKRATASIIGGATRENADSKRRTIDSKRGDVAHRVGRGSHTPRKKCYQHEKAYEQVSLVAIVEHRALGAEWKACSVRGHGCIINGYASEGLVSAGLE